MEKATNIDNLKIMDEFADELLHGQIKLASVRGYQSNPKHPQQDAIGSIVKNNNCFLNIVADGLGGVEKSENASRQLVTELIKWFEQIDPTQFKDKNLTIKQLKRKIREIHRKIYIQYHGKAQTTFALSLTSPYNIIIANVGDSTVYTYNNELELLTYIKFYLNNKPYEKIRRNILSMFVGESIGSIPLTKIHTNIIENKGQKLILSTDGVTDLINEERFTNYFLKDVDAKTIVNDALTTPDVVFKKEDNISAITVTLPTSNKKEKQYTLKQ